MTSVQTEKGLLQTFWSWYERHYVLNLTVTTILFALQLIHLYWLAAHVIALRLLDTSFFTLTPLWQNIIVFVDYTEVPALLSATTLYLYDLTKKKKVRKSVLFLLFLNSQWLHIFWITDEFVVSQLVNGTTGTVLPVWLAWVAILIDYLEVPVIIDTVLRLGRSLKSEGVKAVLK